MSPVLAYTGRALALALAPTAAPAPALYPPRCCGTGGGGGGDCDARGADHRRRRRDASMVSPRCASTAAAGVALLLLSRDADGQLGVAHASPAGAPAPSNLPRPPSLRRSLPWSGSRLTCRRAEPGASVCMRLPLPPLSRKATGPLTGRCLAADMATISGTDSGSPLLTSCLSWPLCRACVPRPSPAAAVACPATGLWRRPRR